MDRIGLLDSINESALSIDIGRKGQNTNGMEHEGRVSYHNGLALALETFKKVQERMAEDLELAVLTEKAFVTQELQFCAPSEKNAISSLINAVKTIDESLRALKVLETDSIYTAVHECLPYRKECRYNNMPKDAFHYMCAGHQTRIENILKAPGISLAEKELLKQRYDNLVKAQSIYYEKQKNVLGSNPP